MSNYMPTTEEIGGAVVSGMATPGDQARSETWWRLAFNRWLEDEIRKAKAEALREAAEDIDVSTYYRTPYKAEQHEIAAAYRATLLDRAEQIEEDQ